MSDSIGRETCTVATQPGRKEWNKLAAAERPVTLAARGLGMSHSSRINLVSNRTGHSKRPRSPLLKRAT